jgi:flagellar assembly factor FliW
VSATNPLQAADAATVHINHPEGQLEVPASAVVRLTEPLYGFPDRLEYALIPAARQGLWWFISVHQPTVTFLVADPFRAKPGCTVDLTETDCQALDVTAPEDALILVMVTLPVASGAPATANFRAPLVLNLRARRAAQTISLDDSARLQEPIDLASFSEPSDGFSFL